MDKQLFIRNVESCQGAVRRFLTALCCGDTFLADDLAQETFIKAFISIDSLKDNNSFNSWVFKIANNIFISHVRSHKTNSDIKEAENLISSNRTDSVFEYQGLYKALDELSENERSTVLLFYMQGYSINEIAEITSSSVSTVKQRLSRGRFHLKKLLS